MSRNKPKNPVPSNQTKNQIIQGTPISPSQEGQIKKIIAEYSESFEGPLPHPKTLEQYDLLVPGSAKQIIDIFRDQSHHRMELEKTVINGDSKRAYIGLGCGLLVSLLSFYLSYALIMRGDAAYGFILSGLNLTALVSVFVYGTQIRRSERVEKETIRRKK